LQERLRGFASKTWWLVLLLTAAVTVASFRMQPNIMKEFSDRPWGRNFSIARDRRAARHVDRQRAQTRPRCVPEPVPLSRRHADQCGLAVYPYVQPSNAAPETSLIIHNAAAAEYGLWIGSSWWIPGMALAVFYSFFRLPALCR
jgi:cytochrome bd-type quinol oxidase subunit 2